MRVILLGPPGSGKGTQAYLVSTKYNIPNISAGEILRRFCTKKKSVLNKIHYNTKNIIDSGNLVSDKLVIELIIERVNQYDCINGFILDGFPRTIVQAQSMQEQNITIDFVINFYISDSAIIDRIMGRQIHLKSGRTYHVKFNPPKRYGVDDITGELLTVRKDDNTESVKQRLAQYHSHTKSILDFYYKISQKRSLHYFTINGDRPIIKVYNELLDILNKNILIK